ncbi:hypothetical protein EK21DRAFT_117891 [Setomelanomma holmii]|uniref:C2H2-type domain-containing protein n=1 Tax=Setomelanomma holmii TaxID=210430 RepID=A0A9P4GYH1_9PLEO|nr:hypothetical protein EK21DRAFT_117891 [Setomelanomma holmii]
MSALDRLDPFLDLNEASFKCDDVQFEWEAFLDPSVLDLELVSQDLTFSGQDKSSEKQGDEFPSMVTSQPPAMPKAETRKRTLECPVFVAERSHGRKRSCNNIIAQSMSQVRRHLIRPSKGYPAQLSFLKLCPTCNEDIVDRDEFEKFHGQNGQLCNLVRQQRKGEKAKEQWNALYHTVETHLKMDYQLCNTTLHSSYETETVKHYLNASSVGPLEAWLPTYHNVFSSSPEVSSQTLMTEHLGEQTSIKGPTTQYPDFKDMLAASSFGTDFSEAPNGESMILSLDASLNNFTNYLETVSDTANGSPIESMQHFRDDSNPTQSLHSWIPATEYASSCKTMTPLAMADVDLAPGDQFHSSQGPVDSPPIQRSRLGRFWTKLVAKSRVSSKAQACVIDLLAAMQQDDLEDLIDDKGTEKHRHRRNSLPPESGSSSDTFEASTPGRGALCCVTEGCTAKYTGLYRKSNFARHLRLKHRGSETTTFACEELSCDRIFQRQDARLQHYRKQHPDRLSKPYSIPIRSETWQTHPGFRNSE